ncbi:MAG: MMPL family transporter, partial [Hyphomicrobiales bacterium]|nr:MMPL family transporter [Hyphomicrobiales bacterium]
MKTNTDQRPGGFRFSIGFGLEQIGVVAVRHRMVGGLIVIVLTAMCALGLSRLGFDDELRNIFHSSSLDHKTFEEFEATFGNTESDLFVLITGDTLATPDAMAALREFTFDLRLEDGVASAASLFSLRNAPDENDDAPTVMPQALPSGTDLEILFERIDKHPLGLGKLISPDRTAALVIVALDPGHQGLKEAATVTDAVKGLAQETFQPLGLSAEVAGIPVLRIELVARLLQDQVRIVSLGMGLAFLISGVMFRSLIGALVTTVPAIMAVVWVLGLMGLIGVKINLTTTILPVLILVLAFADSMHITTDLLRAYVKGEKRKTAAIAAIREIGPACALTSLTTAIAFLTLTLSESHAIRELGITGSLATLLSFAAVITIGPLMFLLLARGPIAPPSERSGFFRWLGIIAHRFGSIGWRRPLLTTIVGTLIVVVVGIGHAQLRPEFSFHEHLGKDIPTVQAMARINHEFGGSNPVH